MKKHTVLGIDPGIANTGLAVVKQNRVGYSLITAETVKTKASEPTGARLSAIHDEINATLDAWKITGIAIERVFHNRNVSSSLTTGAVLGLVNLVAHQRGIANRRIHTATNQKMLWTGSKGRQAADVNDRKPSFWIDDPITSRGGRSIVRPL